MNNESLYIQKDLGVVTAYGEAVAGGYSSTREQFQRDLAKVGRFDYNDFNNKPQINNVTLEGNKTSAELGLASASDITALSQSINGIQTSVSNISYDSLSNKPSINGVTLSGSMTSNQLGIVTETEPISQLAIEYKGNKIGYFHGIGWDDHPDIRGLMVDMEEAGSYVGWGYRTGNKGSYMTKLIYVGSEAPSDWLSEQGYEADKVNLCTGFYARGNEIKSPNLVDVRAEGSASLNGTYWLKNSNGETCSLTFNSGILTAVTGF